MNEPTVDRDAMNAAIVAVDNGTATEEQRVLVAAFHTAIDRRLIRDEAGLVIGIMGPPGPTYGGKPLPKPILEAFIALVGAAGGEIRVPERWQLDADQYELVVSDPHPGTGERVFRVRRVEPAAGEASLQCTDSAACPVERHVYQDGYGCRAI